MDTGKASEKHVTDNARSRPLDKKQPSLSSLIMWNVSMALEKNPNIDLRRAMRLAHERMEQQSHDVQDLVSQYPEERHITCAVLAWQQLGHNDTDSLYEFIESRQNRILRNTSENSTRKENIYCVNSSDTSKRPKGFIDHKPSTYRSGVESPSFDIYPLTGPVVKLPAESKVVMRVENTSSCARHGAKKTPKSDIKNKVDAACCRDSACSEKLKEMEKSTAELRARATRLARREAERGELLERAEAAWRDLELGYQRRLLLAEEKEEDIAKQIKKSIEDRNAYKHACTVLAQQLGTRSDIVESERAQLGQVEKQVCELACTRLQLSEDCTKGDAAVADQHCKNVQLERDLQFREEQARRKLLSIESVMDSSRGLTLEAERAMREELGMIKEQIGEVSNQLLKEDAENNRIKTELEELRQQKTEIFEDLEGCKQVCDNRMQSIVNDLNSKRQVLKELKDKVIECQCKLPLDEAVEVKRTPSLAALCRCNAEEHILHTCSCTSVRSTLLSNLLADLFGGLQAELGDTGSRMPCQLLKCLEDKHNWDRASIVKSNLRSFFSQLLVGELDTAIATSIEKYHATWVGVSCADTARMIPDPGEFDNEGWQERALERRAQKLAGHLAEQLFQERADQLMKRAKDIVTSGPPPCECRQQSNKAAVYPCLVKPLTIGGVSKKNDINYPTYMKKTLQDVNLLRTQIEDLKKESIKKEDLKVMEEKITKIVQKASSPDGTTVVVKHTRKGGEKVKQTLINRSVNTVDMLAIDKYKLHDFRKKKSGNLGSIRKHIKKSTDINGKEIDRKLLPEKSQKIMEQSFAVNLCLFDGKKKPNGKLEEITMEDLNIWNENQPQHMASTVPSIKQSRPIEKMLSKNSSTLKNKKNSPKTPCTCFHKVPSNTSIDKLLEALLKWKGDILNYSVFNMVPSVLTKSTSNIKEIHHDSEFSNNKISVNISTIQKDNPQNINKNVKATDIDQLPPLTTSEYIGAINLDKSNDYICKCSIKHNKENETKYGNYVSNDNLLFKCSDKSKCRCKKSNEMKKKQMYEQAEHSTRTTNENLIVKALTDIKQLYDENSLIERQRASDECKTATLFNHKNNQTSETYILPDDKGALVKFLGVTLTDMKDNKRLVNNRCKGKHVKNNCNTSVSKPKQPNFYSKVLSSVKSENQTHPCDIDNIDLVKESKTNVCHFVELYTNLDKTINECKENNNAENSIHCLGEILCNRKSCICCKYDDETKNLEVNTFCLLEKHLKQKLAELRKSSGNSACILPADEEKVFITILDKVKQVISNYTCRIKCECSVTSNNSGSWVRFNNLLEEYLKIKIKRAQCSCVPNKESLETILPNVLEQVSNLIENDFERLKSVRNYKNINSLEYDRNMYTHNENQPIIKSIENQNLQTDKSSNIFENVSIQGSCNPELEDKSCNATEIKDSKDVQTSQNKLCLESRSVEVTISHYCTLQNELHFNKYSTKNDKEIKSQSLCAEHPRTLPKSSQVKLHNDNKDMNIVTSKRSLGVPYIGYTLSCSCDNKLGACVCSKSLSQSYGKNTENIWKMIEINSKKVPNLSYIMHSIAKKAKSEDNIVKSVEGAEASFTPVIRVSQSVNNIYASDGEEVVLKESGEKLKNIDINDNMTSTLDDLVSVKTECLNDEEASYWYDCSNHNVKNDVRYKKLLYESIYSPISKLPKNGKSDISMKNNTSMCTSKSKNCDCVMVPVCHVKMLVENIESKLVNSQCTCDSFSAQVCPFHSKM